MSKNDKWNFGVGAKSTVDEAILGMKRAACVSTDSELAAAIGLSQSAIAHWRRRGAVPQSAILKFERALEAGSISNPERALYARALAISLSEFRIDKARKSGTFVDRWLTFGVGSAELDLICDECYYQIAVTERYYGISTEESVRGLLNSQAFYEALDVWAQAIPERVVSARQAQSPMQIRSIPDGLHISPQVPQADLANDED